MSRVSRWLIVVLAFALVPLACSRKRPEPIDVPKFEKPANAGQASAEDRATLVKDNTAFALELHRALPRDGNLIVSPFAVSSVLSMTLAGAKGQTADEMKRALRLSLDDDKLHPAFARLLWDLHGQGKPRGYQLRLANALWADDDIVLEKPFLDTLTGNYSIGGQVVDFSQREQAAAKINAWVKEQTDGRIEEVIAPAELDENVRFFLASAVAFKGTWEKKFSPRETRDGKFHLSKDKSVEVPMMQQEGEFRFYPFDGGEERIESVRVLRLAFSGGEMEFVALLPGEKESLADLEKNLTAKKLDEYLNIPWERKVRVTLPRFDLGSRLLLVDTMKALGMKSAFERGEADFTGVSKEPAMHIDRVTQEAKVAINEEGGTATALAKEKGREKGGPPPGSISFRADRPFLFLIRHAPTRTVLFMGRVVDPR